MKSNAFEGFDTVVITCATSYWNYVVGYLPYRIQVIIVAELEYRCDHVVNIEMLW